MKIPLALAFCFLVSTANTWAHLPISFPPEHCSDKWNPVQEKDFLFDFRSDTASFPHNITTDDGRSYQNYLTRMSRKSLNRKDCHKSWTVFIYMNATSDLAPYAYADLNEMEANLKSELSQSLSHSGSSLRTDVIVQMKIENEAKLRRLHVFSHPDKAFTPLNKNDLSKLTKEQIQSPVIVTLDPTENSSEGLELERFLKWGIQEFPSEHYLLILWGHGKLAKLSIDSSGRFLSPEELQLGLHQVQEWSGDKLDILAIDSCYWMAVDDIERISHCTQYVCGSSDAESNAGLPYGNLLRELNSGNFMDAPNRNYKDDILNSESYCLAWAIPQLYQESFFPQHGSQSLLDPNACCRLTSCSIQSKHFRNSLLPALNRLGLALVKLMNDDPDRWIDIKGIIENGKLYQNSTQDLGALLKNLAQYLEEEQTESQGIEPRLRDAFQTLNSAITLTYRALNYSIIHSVLGSNYPRFDATQELGPRGLSIWLPKSREEFDRHIQDFSKSALYSVNDQGLLPGWRQWIEKMCSY